MKIGLISDVHADPLSLELAWTHLRVLGAERVLCAGDLVGYGPFPDRAVAFVISHKIEAIRGNHDRWAIGRGPGVRDEFGGAAPSAKTIETLQSLTTSSILALDGRTLAVFHGSPASDMEYIRKATHGPEVLDRLLRDLSVDVLVVGHTHAPMCYRGDLGLVVNPGSVISMPVVRTSRTFALLDTKTLAVSIHDVETGRSLEVPDWT